MIMDKKAWTVEDEAVVCSSLPIEVIANQLGRSRGSCATRRWQLRKTGREVSLTQPVQPGQVAPATLETDRIQARSDSWERQHAALSSKYNTLLREAAIDDRLVAEILAAAPKSYTAAPSIWQSNRRSSGQPQSAVLMLSDTHVGAVVRPDQTMKFGSYDFPTFLARLKYLEESVISITRNHTCTEVPELVVAILGDMVDGALSHANECGQMTPMFNQVYLAAHAIAQFLRNLEPHFPKLRIYDEPGNHPRYQNQHKMPTKNKHSNFDKFMCALVQALVRDIPSIEWTLNTQPFAEFEVQGHQFLGFHGEILRGGDKTLGIPNHAIGRAISATTQLFNKHDRPAPNYYLVGHLHRDISIPHATGSFLVNGGFVGVDEFGLNSMFTPADPTQKFFFVHPVYGKTATYDISLKFAEVGAAPYTMPEGFEIV